MWLSYSPQGVGLANGFDMSSADSSAKDDKAAPKAEKAAPKAEKAGAKDGGAGGKFPPGSLHNWAVVLFLVLVVWAIIHTSHTQPGRHSAYLCTFDALKEFALTKDPDGLARISNSCAGSKVAGEARRTLWDWASADWRRATVKNTVDGYSEFCSTWKRYELTDKYYDCSNAPKAERIPVAYKDGAWRPNKQINGAELDGEYVAQVYNGATRDGAEAYSDGLKRRHSGILDGLTVAVEEGGRRGYAREHKVLIGPLANKRDADSLCWELKNRNVDCFAKPSAEVLN
jgi:hypothetical protein